MLPTELAEFSFHPGEFGSDGDLAARTLGLAAGGRILVFGALRTGLLRALLEGDSEVVVVDSSRSALVRTRDAFPGAAQSGRLALFAEDPRELEVPGGARVALVPSLPWRAVVLAEDRLRILAALRRVVEHGGALCLDVESLPKPPPVEEEPVGAGVGAGAFTWRRCDSDWHTLALCCRPGGDARGGESIEVQLSDAAPERLRDELLEAGFRIDRIEFASGAPSGPRWFLVARP